MFWKCNATLMQWKLSVNIYVDKRHKKKTYRCNLIFDQFVYT
jgi:hypothetical protein